MENIGVSNLPNLSHKKQMAKPNYFNIMVAGSRGVGKTTYIEKLLQKKLGEKFEKLYCNENFGLSESRDIENMIEFREYKTRIVERNSVTFFNIIEVNDIGDFVNNENCAVPLMNYIIKQNIDFFNNEKVKVPSIIKDQRIHLMLYFFDASAPRAVDLFIMNELSKYVNVVPCSSRSEFLMETEQNLIKNSSVYSELKTFGDVQFISKIKGDDMLEDLIKNQMMVLKNLTDDYYNIFKRKNVIMSLINEFREENEDAKFLKEFLEIDSNI